MLIMYNVQQWYQSLDFKGIHYVLFSLDKKNINCLLVNGIIARGLPCGFWCIKTKDILK